MDTSVVTPQGMVLVSVDADGHPVPHGYRELTRTRDPLSPITWPAPIRSR